MKLLEYHGCSGLSITNSIDYKLLKMLSRFRSLIPISTITLEKVEEFSEVENFFLNYQIKIILLKQKKQLVINWYRF